MKAAKNIIVLTIITVLAGFLLGYVYDITKEPIEEATLKAKQEAYSSVFSSANSFTELAGFDSSVATNGVINAGISGVSIDEALEAKDASGNLLGFVFTVTSSEGYGGDVQLSMGVTNDGILNGISLLSISETAGLGMQAEKVLVPQFHEKNVELFARHRVYSEIELASRYKMKLDTYSKVLRIEALTMREMLWQDILPAVSAYSKVLADTVASKQAIGVTPAFESELVKKINGLIVSAVSDGKALEDAVQDVETITECYTRAMAYKNDVLPVMDSLRETVDTLESLTAKAFWPYPAYGDILFSVK